MKKLAIALVGLMLLSFSVSSQEKRASPKKEVKAMIGDVTISIVYGSPSVKGREIFGGLEPWGKVWRAGANEATTMEFSDDVSIEGHELAKGKYSFFVIPNEDAEWTLIFNKVADQWGAYKYDDSEDALRIDVSPTTIDNQEQLRYTFTQDDHIILEWATTRVGFAVE